MTVVCLSDCPASLRGDLTKWMVEINTGVYVGTFHSRVREQLWERICANLKNGKATMVYSAPGEQKMAFCVHNTVKSELPMMNLLASGVPKMENSRKQILQ